MHLALGKETVKADSCEKTLEIQASGIHVVEGEVLRFTQSLRSKKGFFCIASSSLAWFYEDLGYHSPCGVQAERTNHFSVANDVESCIGTCFERLFAVLPTRLALPPPEAQELLPFQRDQAFAWPSISFQSMAGQCPNGGKTVFLVEFFCPIIGIQDF